MEFDLCNAVEHVRLKRLSYREACRRYGVPKTILMRSVNGEVEIGTRPGPQTLLTPEEEKEIIDWILRLTDHGAAPSRGMWSERSSPIFNNTVAKVFG